MNSNLTSFFWRGIWIRFFFRFFVRLQNTELDIVRDLTSYYCLSKMLCLTMFMLTMLCSTFVKFAFNILITTYSELSCQWSGWEMHQDSLKKFNSLNFQTCRWIIIDFLLQCPKRTHVRTGESPYPYTWKHSPLTPPPNVSLTLQNMFKKQLISSLNIFKFKVGDFPINQKITLGNYTLETKWVWSHYAEKRNVYHANKSRI